jgi:hypothetical protein
MPGKSNPKPRPRPAPEQDLDDWIFQGEEPYVSER